MKVKKIAALAVGAAMVGATIGFASATNVPQIPKSFFVKNDGTPNVKIVVGSNAAAMDVASAADIAVALGSLLYTTEQVEAQNAYVKVKEVIPPKTEAKWTIYAFNYTTITVDHNISSISDWPMNYSALENYDDYWWNGAAFTANYTQWEDGFKVSKDLKEKDSVNDKYSVDWHININKVELKSLDPKNWSKAVPPKKADLVIPPGSMTILVDYVLYNYTYTKKVKVSPGNPEFGVSPTYKYVNKTVIGDKEEVPDHVVKNETYLPGVKPGDDFTVFGQKYHVYKVGDGTFTVGFVGEKDPDWFKLHESRVIGDRWKVTIQDIGIKQNSAIILVTDTENNQQVTVLINSTAPAYIYYDDSGQLTWSHSPVTEAGLYLELRSTFVGIDNTIMASIYYVYDMKKYTSDNFHPAAGWNATIGTYQYNGKWYIANVTLINDKKFEGNPLDILGAYDLMYKFVTHEYDEYFNGTDVVKAPKKKHFITAYAYICLKEKEGKVIEKELKVGDKLPDSDYTVEEIGATFDQIVLKPATQPITVMDFEVNVSDPGSNLILVGGPVANSVTKYLVDEGKSKVDWYNSPGDVEYIPDAFGSYGAVIVAGATRNETKVAAEALMQYLAELAKE